MATYSKYLYQLIQSVAQSFNDCVTGTITSTSTNATIVCNTLLKADDYYNGWDCHFYVGTHKDTTREVTDWVNSTTTLTFSPAVTNICDNTDYFMLCNQFTYAQYKDAVQRAVEMGKTEFLLNKVDATTTQVDDTFEYSVPSGFRYISKIIVEEDVNTDEYYETNAILPADWVILKDATTPKIRFKYEYTEGVQFQITGQSMQTALTNDADTCYMPPEFVIQQARALLMMSNVTKFKDSLAPALQLATLERRMMSTPPYPNSKAIYEV